MIEKIMLGLAISIFLITLIILSINYFYKNNSQNLHKPHHHNNPPDHHPDTPKIPSDFLTDMGMPSSCIDKTSFQTTAKNFVPDAFKSFTDCLNKAITPSTSGKESPITMCARTDQILKLRDYLKIFSFAYFPFEQTSTSEGIKYTQYTCKIKSTPKNKEITTYDPVEVVLYYCSELYTIIGSIADTANSDKHKDLHACLLQSGIQLVKDAQNLFSKPIMGSTIDWTTYFSNPGPYGSTSGNVNSPVKWAIKKSVNSKSPSTCLYLEVNKRDIGGQFWGNVKPDQDSTTASAIGKLVKVQTEECIKRYNNMKNTNKKGSWTDVILNTDNIDTFHKFRKSIRTLGRTLETYSFQVSAMYAEIPDNLKTAIANQFKVIIKAKYYKEALCLGEYNKRQGYPTPPAPCNTETILAFLLFGNFYNPTMWGLKQDEYDVLRAMVLMYTLRIGTKKSTDYNISSVTDKTILCPSIMDSYPNMKINPPSATGNYIWNKPSLSSDNQLLGTFCEIDDIMGDLHDIMVYYQQNSDSASESIKQYISNSSKQVELFFTELNIEQMMNTISKNVC